jgi:hypothetical protein
LSRQGGRVLEIRIGNHSDDDLRFGLIENEYRTRLLLSGHCEMFLKDGLL